MSQVVRQAILTLFLVAGAWAGVAGLLTFLVIHHFWIQPIWLIAPVGLLIAALGGLALGWSYTEIHAALPSHPWTFLTLTAISGVILAPAILLAQIRAHILGVATFSIPPQAGPRLALHFITELVLTAVIASASAGWFLGRTPQATIATAVADLAYALGSGHNIPLLGNMPAVGNGLILLLVITLLSSLVLVEVSAGLIKGGR